MVSSPVSMKPRNDATVPQSAAPGISVRVVVLLAVAAFINYVDRGNLATAGPLIRDELALSNAQLGVLLSAFFWSYAPAQLLAGWLAERRDARVVLAAGLAVGWSDRIDRHCERVCDTLTATPRARPGRERHVSRELQTTCSRCIG